MMFPFMLPGSVDSSVSILASSCHCQIFVFLPDKEYKKYLIALIFIFLIIICVRTYFIYKFVSD